MLTDPSYAGQILTLTYPLIGNYGVAEDDTESRRVQVSGFVVRELCREPVPLDAVLARLAPAADARAVQRVRALASPPRPAAAAERELRRAAVEAKIEAIRREQSQLLAMVARAGSPPPEDLTRDQLVLQRRRQDLERRREELRRT
jgi:regulator of protease activity HflC (stomatin/prohibitin superfamily)